MTINFLTTYLVLLISCKLFAQVSVPNDGFEFVDNTSPIKTQKWKMESNDFICISDKNAVYEGKYSLRISSKAQGNHFFNEEFQFSTVGLKKYKIRCAFKTNNLQGALKLGARVFDKDGNTISLTQFTLSEIKNQDWQIGEGIFISDNKASKLRVFGNLAGTGEAWFDEIKIDELPAPQKSPSPEVELYIHEYFDIVYQNSIINDKIFIAELKRKTMYFCRDCVDKSQCYKVLKDYTTRNLNDNHSFFTTATEYKEMIEGGIHPGNSENLHNYPTGKMLKENIAYISLPMFVSNDTKLQALYADSIQNMIANFDNRNPKGYIIDLSNNGGGNCFPMIAGVGPLIGNGVCELSFSGNGTLSKVIYNEGWTGRDTTLMFQKTNPYHLKHPDKPIAIIYGSGTASSGEVTAIAFIGLANTKSFGKETAGATTRVDNFQMSDGAYLNLASGIDGDRNKNKFIGKIKPDIATTDTEAAITEAIRWILDMAK